MLTLRPVETDDDFADVRRIRMTIMPYERADTVEQMRASVRPEQLMVLAERDGEVVGSGGAHRSMLVDCAVVVPRVLPDARRQGIGTTLLRELIAHATTLGRPRVIAHCDDEGSKAFAERFGFVEVDRQVEQVRQIGVEPVPTPPPGVEFVTVAERPDLWDVAYERVGTQAFEDMALSSPRVVSLREWRTEWIRDPTAMLLALVDGDVVGMAGLIADPDVPDRAENALTAVRREWRGKGLASALKRMTLASAAAHGIREVYTWTQKGNADMRWLNEHLGYTTRLQSFTMRAELPLEV